MRYNIKDIIREVRITLDENITHNELFSNDANTLTLDEIIKQKIYHSLRTVLNSAPINMLDEGVDFSLSEIIWRSGCQGIGSGRIRLPKDFLRLLVFRMSDWRIPVTYAIDESDPSYLIQSSKFVGVKGSPSRPICILTRDGNGRVLEFLSCSQGDGVGVEVARYIPNPIISEDSVDIPAHLYEAFIYQTAGLTAVTYKDQHSEVLFNIANGFLDIGGVADKKQ